MNLTNKIKIFIKKQLKNIKENQKEKQEEKQVQKIFKLLPENTQNHISEIIIRNILHSFKQYEQYNNISQQNKDFILKLLPPLLENISLLNKFVSIQPLKGPVGMVHFLAWNEQEKQTLEIQRKAVECYTRKSKSRFSIEAKQDVSTLHGIDIQEEIINMIVDNITFEFMKDILQHFNVKEQYNINNPSFENSIQPKLDGLRNQIAKNTKRGSGNVLIMNPIVYDRFFYNNYLRKSIENNNIIDNKIREIKTKKLSKEDLDEKVKKLSQSYENIPKNISELNYTLDCAYESTTTTIIVTSAIEEENVIVTYAGSNSIDKSVIFSPYVLLLISSSSLVEETFQPQIPLLTRYALNTTPNHENYYEVLKIEQ